MKLVYFAWVRTRIGKPGEAVDLPSGIGTAAELIDWLAGRGDTYAHAFADRRAIRVAVNHRFVGPDHPVAPGDEVALFPPVTGG